MHVRTLAVTAVVLLSGLPANAQQAPLPPPPVSLTVPRPIPPVPPQRDLYQQPQPPAPPPVYQPGWIFYPQGVYVPGGYGPSVPMAPQSAPMMTVAAGWMRFETTPGSAQVFVDGAYAGVI